MHAPRVEQVEALRLETEHFASCIATGQRPINDGASGLRVVKLLEACNASLRQNGREIPV
jgi:predicted dehydrogenase